MRRVIAAAITAAMLLFALLTVGCGTTELAEATGGDRFSFEYAGTTGGYSSVVAWVMTDTETGHQWVVLCSTGTGGGVAVEPLYQYARVEPSQDWGE